MKTTKQILTMIASVILLLTVVYFAGRYGWKSGGFGTGESAGIEKVTVEENQVHIRGVYPGSFPTGFLGYHAEQVGDTLYVGFKFSGLFGIFETGGFVFSAEAVREIPAQRKFGRKRSKLRSGMLYSFHPILREIRKTLQRATKDDNTARDEKAKSGCGSRQIMVYQGESQQW